MPWTGYSKSCCRVASQLYPDDGGNYVVARHPHTIFMQKQHRLESNHTIGWNIDRVNETWTLSSSGRRTTCCWAVWRSRELCQKVENILILPPDRPNSTSTVFSWHSSCQQLTRPLSPLVLDAGRDWRTEGEKIKVGSACKSIAAMKLMQWRISLIFWRGRADKTETMDSCSGWLGK